MRLEELKKIIEQEHLDNKIGAPLPQLDKLPAEAAEPKNKTSDKPKGPPPGGGTEKTPPPEKQQ
jgi:hypothetical protein